MSFFKHLKDRFRRDRVTLQLDDIQALILRSRPEPYVGIHAMLHVDEAEGGRDLIAHERAKLAEVRAERQRGLDAWFAEKAGEWDLVSKLGGQEREVEEALAAAARVPSVGRLLDIGTGTGLVLGLLAAEAESAFGIDRSPEMLRLARAKLSEGGRQLAELRHADMLQLPFEDGSFDTVTLVQVLHFADDPAAVVAEAERVLAPGGKLLIAEFAPHNHEELRERFHHARLGFDEVTVLHWLDSAGLSPRVVSRHPGTRLQVHVTEGRKGGLPAN